MKTFHSELLAVSFSVANVLGTPISQDDTNLSVNGFIAQCEAAHNCEVYDAPWAKAIRFKTGIKPGTAAYNDTVYGGDAARSGVSARGVNHANLGIGQNQMNYGAFNPYNVIAILWSPSQQSACSENPYQVGTAYVVGETAGGYWGTKRLPANINVHVRGQYDGWDKRAALMTAMLQMSQERQSWQEKSWQQWQWVTDSSGGHGVIISKALNEKDFMTVWFDLQVGDKAGIGCAAAANLVGDVIGIISGDLAAIFGTLIGIVS